MTASNNNNARADFISYASEDTEAAGRIAASLEAAGNADPNSVLVLRGDFTHKDFWLIDLKTGAERRLTQLAVDFDIRDFDLSADKSAILFDRVEESSTVALIERTG